AGGSAARRDSGEPKPAERTPAAPLIITFKKFFLLRVCGRNVFKYCSPHAGYVYCPGTSGPTPRSENGSNYPRRNVRVFWRRGSSSRIIERRTSGPVLASWSHFNESKRNPVRSK